MEPAGNGGVLKSRLQALHIHVLLIALLGTGHMARPGTGQHKGGIAVRETARHTGAAAVLPVNRSMTWLVRIRVRRSLGKSQ